MTEHYFKTAQERIGSASLDYVPDSQQAAFNLGEPA
jgi:hypothetical protein